MHPSVGGGLQPSHPSKPQRPKFKNTDFIDTMKSKVLFDLLFSWYQPLKSGFDNCIRICKNELTEWKRNKIGHCDWVTQHVVIFVCIQMQPQAVLWYSHTNNMIFIIQFLTLTLLMWRIWWAPNNASRWQMEFNLAFKGLK